MSMVIIWHTLIALVLSIFQKKSIGLLATTDFQNKDLWLGNARILFHWIYWFHDQRPGANSGYVKSVRLTNLFFLKYVTKTILRDNKNCVEAKLTKRKFLSTVYSYQPFFISFPSMIFPANLHDPWWDHSHKNFFTFMIVMK